MMKRYAITSLYNMRDLGGYTTKDHQSTALGKIIRSDCPIGFNADYLQRLEALKIGCVIDLRTPEEAETKPSYFAGKEFIEYHNITFENGNGTPESEESIPPTYLKMMEERDAINKILSVISTSQSNVLYHCAVGKDRTGIISAIILSICNVPTEEIIADYQVSDTYLHPLLSAMRSNNPDLPDWLGRSKPEYMRQCLAMLENKYGSFDGYIKALNIPDETLEGIREKLELR